MEILIKNMVSNRCKMIVEQAFYKLDIYEIQTSLGKVITPHPISLEQLDSLKTELSYNGFQVLENKKLILVERIKNVIIEMIYFENEVLRINFSCYLADKLNQDYTYLANIFSETQKITIEHFIILHKIERVKQLITYDELTLTEISYKMHYSSVAHLSSQFKKTTGLTPSEFKNQLNPILFCIENV
ncbi:MAG: helix-turn-helix transcriptional regulator [Sphingobacteriales bacterium]|nr:helix-turn-helix transcriptional regulator [Sphingobacteriales bacterium]